MNIFYTNRDPVLAAEDHCDKHVVKMILETAQLLCSAHRILDTDVPEVFYKATHTYHPSAIWVRSSRANYQWTYNLFTSLSVEYRIRYGKTHLSWEKLGDALRVPPKNIPDEKFTDPPQCMPDQYKREDAVAAYRAYYIGEKARFAQWEYTNQPAWWPVNLGPRRTTCHSDSLT